jgi:hypothetical protein
MHAEIGTSQDRPTPTLAEYALITAAAPEAMWNAVLGDYRKPLVSRDDPAPVAA